MSQISPGLNTVPKEHPQLPGRGGCSQRGCAVGVPRDVGHRRERPESRRRKVFSRVKKKNTKERRTRRAVGRQRCCIESRGGTVG